MITPPKHDLGRILNISNYSTLVHLATKMRIRRKKGKKLKLIISDDAAADAYDTSNEHISR